mmetsp:Transcript_30457/g.45043  ORF Transcript_30457/g.45043 Transcript_30457/m.45043 type:complete len:502 (+) Transcript_30457:75-1580(+)
MITAPNPTYEPVQNVPQSDLELPICVETWTEEDDGAVEAASARRITGLDAASALAKGNLGVGCLNLPHAFALTGWALGSCLFCAVAIQGIYSMSLLTHCKQLLVDHGKKGKTFMDCAYLALGEFGQRLVQVFLFILQVGVCCVFLSLVSTNLEGALTAANLKLSSGVCTAIVTFVLLMLVLLRFIRDLRWLSAIANAFMITAIFTAAIAGLTEVAENIDQLLPPKASTSSIENIVIFVSAMFFAFEGIGLVIPIENSFTVGYSHPMEEKRANKNFRGLLVLAMSFVAFLFLLIGLSASIGFPDIENGSATDYLAVRYPSNSWYQIVNGLVIIAVLFTFPLQLTPAIEVLDEWFGSRCRPLCCTTTTIVQEEMNAGDVTPEETTQNDEDDWIQDHNHDASLPYSPSSFWKYEWIFRRWIMVLGCMVMVLAVSNLSALISLFGAIGQTGLAAMPCLMHLSLQRQGIAPKNTLRSIIDVFIILFCAVVMVMGLVFSVREIMETH